MLVFPSPLERQGYALELPLSILAVAAPLHAEGYQMVLIDERLSADVEKELLEATEGAMCVGFSTITGHQLKRTIHLSRLLKRHHSQVPVVWGGYHPSLLPEQVASEPYVDAVVRGQGEVTFRQLVGRLEENQGFDGVAGITYRDDSGGVVSNPDRPVEDINSFPRAPYELLDIERFFHMNGGRRAIQYFSSQGCPFKCAFCVEPKVFGKWTARIADTVVNDIDRLNRMYRLEHVSFADANFFANTKRVEAISRQLLDRDIHITWTVTARASQLVKVKPETLSLAKKAGCRTIEIGIESGSEEVLKLIDKRTSPDQAIASNRLLKNAGIHGVYAFMVGFPKELPEANNEIGQTLMLIKKLRREHPDVVTVAFYVTPYPGTQLFDIAQRLRLRMPTKTSEWADWESTSVSTSWISEEDKNLVSSCINFYFPFAYPNRVMRNRMQKLRWMPLLYPLHWIAALRSALNFYRLPLEWKLFGQLSRMKRLRRISSQIDALRGY